MEDALAELGLPRDAWGELTLMPLYPERVADAKDSCLILGPGRDLTERIVADPEGESTQRAFWAAALARVCTAAAAARSPEDRLLLGRLLERFERHLQFPDEGREQLRRLLAERYRRFGRLKAGRIAPHTALVRAAVKHVKATGRPADADTVLAVLTGKDPDAEQLLDEIRWDLARVDEGQGGRRKHSAIDLPGDEPPVDLEGDAVFFHFEKRPDRKISVARFRNAVSEAARSREID